MSEQITAPALQNMRIIQVGPHEVWKLKKLPVGKLGSYFILDAVAGAMRPQWTQEQLDHYRKTGEAPKLSDEDILYNSRLYRDNWDDICAAIRASISNYEATGGPKDDKGNKLPLEERTDIGYTILTVQVFPAILSLNRGNQEGNEDGGIRPPSGKPGGNGEKTESGKTPEESTGEILQDGSEELSLPLPITLGSESESS